MRSFKLVRVMYALVLRNARITMLGVVLQLIQVFFYAFVILKSRLEMLP